MADDARTTLRGIAVPWLADSPTADLLIDTTVAGWHLRDAAHLLRLLTAMEDRPRHHPTVLGWLYITVKMGTTRDGYALIMRAAHLAAARWGHMDPRDLDLPS